MLEEVLARNISEKNEAGKENNSNIIMDGVVLAHCDDEKDGAGLITTTTTTTTAVAAAAWQQATSPPAESRTELKRMMLQIGVKQVNKGEQQSSSSSTILEMEPTSSVGDLKRQIASLQEFDNIPVERQRLIYFGRMLVDNDQVLGDAENNKGLKMRSDDGVINYVHLSPLPEGANPSQRTGASVSPSASSPREGPLRYHPTGRTREVPHDLPAPPSVQQTAALHSPTLQAAILRARRLGAQARERRQRQYHPYPTMMMVHQSYPARGGALPPGRGVVLDAHHDRRPPSQSPPPPAVSLEYYPPAPTPAQPAPAVQVPPGLVPSRSIPDSVGRPQHDTSSASGTSAESNENRLSTLIAAEIERALEARLAEVQQRRRQRQQSPRARLRADIRREAAQFLPVLAEWYSQIERLVQISPTSSAGDHDDDDLYLEPLLRNMQRNLLPMWNEQLRPLLQFWHEQQRQEQHQQRLRQQEQQQQQQQQQQQFQQQLQQQRQQYRQQQHHHHHHQQQQEQHSTSSSSIHVATTNHHPHPSYVNVMRATAYIMFPRPVADHFRYSASALPAVVVAASAAASPTSAPSSPPLVFSPEQHYTV